MPLYNTNIFPIRNLNQLTAHYRLFDIIGLRENSEDFESNIQFIIKKLSYQLGQPITVVPNGSKLCLVVKDDPTVLARIPVEFETKKRDAVYFKSTDQVFTLDFLNYDENTKEICRRFLQFDINGEIQKHRSLWQPRSGQPFFNKNAQEGNQRVAMYSGFLPRIVELPDGGWGISVEITSKYAEKLPLSAHLTRDDFDRLKGNRFIYHYGHSWYEVHPQEWSDLNAADYKFRRDSDGQWTNVIADLHRQAGQSMPPEVAQLPDDVALLTYCNNRNEERRIPAGLCYRVVDTEDPLVGRLHEQSIIAPFQRRRKTHIVRRNYLGKLSYGGIRLDIAEESLQVEKQSFVFPDQLFGNQAVLSVMGTPGATLTTIDEVGRHRKQLLRSVEGGCYVNRAYQRQYLVLPESLANSFGKTHFLKDLKREVNQMHPTKGGWNPEIITYNDRNTKESMELGLEILAQLQKTIDRLAGGYALIIIPQLSRKKRTQDDLATLCVVQGYELLNLEVAIMHTDTLARCFDYRPQGGYFLKTDKQGLYRGYVQGVALNKVLLNNERWPFILNTPLSADLYVGIDVKHSLAGFTFVTKLADNIKPIRIKTKRKEQLLTDQIKTALIINIRKLAVYQTIRTIVIHRDGRLFRPELEGIEEAVAVLKTEGCLPPDATFTVVELPKDSTTTLRLFDELKPYNVLDQSSDNGQVQNPQIGSWVPFNAKEGFVCTTGREFRHKGTSHPLYVKVAHGDMPLETVLRDIYYLSTLAYTKPDDCSRDPLTIKMTDRRINEYGGHYDDEKFDLLRELNQIVL